MRFATIKSLLDFAQHKNIALGAYPANNWETARAAVLAGNELNTPIIFIAGKDLIDYFGGDFVTYVKLLELACQDATVPVCLHLDHSTSYEDCCMAINAGFSSVMIDGSALSFEENVKLTRKVVDFAHPLGVSVEGELGRLKGEEGDLKVVGANASQTDPELARLFVEQTGIDCLAVSIGNQHGTYIAAPQLNIKLLKEINKVVSCPIVLHGGSALPLIKYMRLSATAWSK